MNRFNSDTNYAQGWSDAFRQCESEQEAAQRQARIVIEQQKLVADALVNPFDDSVAE